MSEHRRSATVGLAMSALTAIGHWQAKPIEWLTSQAGDVVTVISQRVGAHGQVAAVMALLVDTGAHGASQPGEAACLRRDAGEIVKAVTSGELGPIRRCGSREEHLSRSLFDCC